MLRKDINPITCLVMFGKTSSKNITPFQAENKKSFAKKFWVSVQKIKYFGADSSRSKTIAAQPVVLKGIAKLAFDLAYGKIDSNEENLKQLWSKLVTNEIDFSHKNKLWGALFLDSEKRNKNFPGIEKYVHVPTGTNLDAGTFDSKTGWVRFGSKHNDIYPRIGDLIRYHLDFEPRKSVSRALNKAVLSPIP